jgi:putative hydrolase
MGMVDLHVHTIESDCGIHTLLEILELARQKGMSLVAITDHDFGRGTRIRVQSYRFPKEWNGVRVLTGIELSVRDGGQVQIPDKVRMEDLDLCLLAFNAEVRTIRDDPVRCTDELESVLRNNPFVDILAHPTIQGFDLDHERTASLLSRYGVAMEVNNCSLRYAKADREATLDLLQKCIHHGVQVAVSSDAHTATELGGDEMALPLLEEAGLPDELLLSKNAERVLAFVEKRRARKKIHSST